MKRGKTHGCESCLPGVPCVLHGSEPRTYDDENDTPAAKRYDSRRTTIERAAMTKLRGRQEDG